MIYYIYTSYKYKDILYIYIYIIYHIYDTVDRYLSKEV